MRDIKWFSKHVAITILALLAAVFLALCFCFTNIWPNSFLRDLFTNMAATAIYAFVAYFTYDAARRVTRRKETRELREYAENDTSPVIFSVLYHSLMKFIYSPEEIGTIDVTGQLVTTTKQDLVARFSKRVFLGFELLKNEDETAKAIRDLIEKPLLLSTFSNNQLTRLIKISNRLQKLCLILSDINNLNKQVSSQQSELKVVRSGNLSSSNTELPNRRLLLRMTRKVNQGVVISFADFDPSITDEQLLTTYVIKDGAVPNVADVILELFSLLNDWIIHSEQGLPRMRK